MTDLHSEDSGSLKPSLGDDFGRTEDSRADSDRGPDDRGSDDSFSDSSLSDSSISDSDRLLRKKPGSVSKLVSKARLGEVLAIERLTEKYLKRLLRYANARMSKKVRQVEDENDVALKVLNEFFIGIMGGKFDGLKNRKQLWRLLARITVCRVMDHYKKFTAPSRGDGEVQNAGNLKSDLDSSVKMIEEVSIGEIDPQLSVALKESYNRMIDSLDEKIDKKIVRLHLAGYSVQKIAWRVLRTPRAVQYRLDMIMEKLRTEMRR